MESNANLLTYTQVGLFEYMLIARPDTNVCEKVVAEKTSFATYYQQKTPVKTQPHITIANFVAREEMEETLIRYTQRVCSAQQSFEVALNNYSGLPPHSIYLRIQDPQPFRHIAKELKVISHYVHSCACPPVRLISNPHLTIAACLAENIYFKAMMDYSQKTFHETFLVNELLLLRRSSHYEDCKTIHVFRLQPAGYNAFKTMLFN